MILLAGFLSYIIAKITIPMVERLLIQSNCIKVNYKGVAIPVCMGIIYVINNVFVSILFLNYLQDIREKIIFVFLIGTFGMAFAGIIDDLLGNKNVQGFRGHIFMMFKGRLTTGGLKAILGGAISFIISSTLSDNISDIIVNFFIISLFTNFINLLDLRPGRALKVLMFFSIIMLFYLDTQMKIILITLISVTIAYLPYDLKGLTMLGDTGSNVIGMTLGIISVYLPKAIKYTLLVFLLIVHIYTEKKSISKLIYNSKILNYIDNFGRKEGDIYDKS